MIIKKLLVPFINDKILQNAEYCFIAAAAISEQAFDLIMSRVSHKCKVEIVTGLDFPADPAVLWKALKQYPNRITFRIHTKNIFHSNVYIFDLPYRKMVAFIGSGNFTMAGFKDNEELFNKIDTEKGVEEIKVWFRSYFEYAEDLSEEIINQYEEIYPSIVEREAASRREKKEMLEFITGSFRWDTADLAKQFFQEEDYKTFESRKAHLNTPLVNFERVRVQNKFLDLHEQLTPFVHNLNLYAQQNPEQIVSSLDPVCHFEHKVNGMWLAYGRGEKELSVYKAKQMDLSHLQIIVRKYDLGIMLVHGKPYSEKADREYFRKEMEIEEYRKKFFDLLKGLGEKYWIDIAGEKRKVASFENENKLWEFTKQDTSNFNFVIGRSYLPDDPDISSGKIIATIQDEFTKLNTLYKLMKDRSFE